MKKAGFFIFLLVFFYAYPGFPDPDLEVSGVVYSDESSAVVDGKFVKEGDDIAGIRVLEIGENYVKFKKGDRVFTRVVGEKTIKTKAMTRLEEFKKKLLGFFKAKKKENVSRKPSGRMKEQGRLEKALGDYMKAQEGIIVVEERDKRAREAIKRKIEAVRGTGLERMVDPDAWDEE